MKGKNLVEDALTQIAAQRAAYPVETDTMHSFLYKLLGDVPLDSEVWILSGELMAYFYAVLEAKDAQIAVLQEANAELQSEADALYEQFEKSVADGLLLQARGLIATKPNIDN